ncbi:glycosyltransferase [bacterium]|nr:glycosyltransferase [bacterium]
MRILFLSSADSIHTARWLRAFTAFGAECRLISIPRGPRLVHGQINLRADRRLHLVDSLKALGPVRRYLRRESPDIVSAHYLTSYGLIAALIDYRPWTLTCWGPEVPLITERSLMDRVRARFVVHRADHVTAAGAAMIPYLFRYGARPEKLSLWPKAVNPDDFPPGRPLEEREPLIVHTRTLDAFYRVDVLIRAFAMVRERIPTVRLELFGEGDAEEELKGLAEELGIAEVVRFRGAQPPDVVGKALGRAALYVAAVPVDAYAFSLLEALACGAYPVVPDNSSNREVLQGSRAALYPAGNVAVLADIFFQALADQKERGLALMENRRLLEVRGELGTGLEGIARVYENLVAAGAVRWR